jgi:hypothetical protein
MSAARQRPVPLTKEDQYIFGHVWAKFDGDGLECVIHSLSSELDRRDADLMLQLTHHDHWERDYTEDRVRRSATAQRLVRHQL